MQAAARRALGQLTYCTNIHPGETWPEVRAALLRHLPAIRREAAPGRPFGVGLRLAAAAAKDLQDPAKMTELQSLLAAEDCYVFTINGFPYGGFHAARVKENVYAPDWSTRERLAYTNLLAEILARLLPEGMAGSISTVPGTFGAWAEGRVEAIAENLVRHAAQLAELERRTGRTIALALEPEPRCLLETIDETATFFETHLYGGRAVALMADLMGVSRGAAAEALRRHLGVCYDVCHAAVEFEDAKASIEQLQSKGIPIPKLQLSAALKIDRVDREAARHLGPFDEPVYLHQVVARNGAGLTRYTDLPQALADLDRTLGSEWRVHFHVPIFLETMERFATTQDFLREILVLHRQRPISDHLEVETYTWDVLPERYRATPVATAIARELNWVRQQLDA
jgi:sugar phosphate isomerase/epimerase